MSNIAKVKIVRDSIWREWIVRAYDADGNRLPDADYHTDNKTDAKQTAEMMVSHLATIPAISTTGDDLLATTCNNLSTTFDNRR